MRGVVLAALAFVASACTRPNAGVCCVSAEDCRSIGANDTERPCSMGLSCIDHQCEVPPPPPPCQTDADCSGGTPHCGPDNTCVGCVDSTQCSGGAPTCDDTTHQCRACASDDDCASGVCDVNMGTCTAEDAIVYASPTGSSTATCAKTDPCSIVQGFAVATSGRETIKLGAGDYTAHVAPGAGTYILDGNGATLRAPVGARVFDIGATTRLTIVGLSIVQMNSDSTNGVALECSSGANAVVLDHVAIDTANTAISVCPFTMTRSTVRGSNPSALALVFASGTITIDRSLFDGGTGLLFTNSGTVAHITNSVIANQNGSLGAFNTLGGNPAGSLFVSYSTVINSAVKCGASGIPICAGGVAEGPCMDNSLIFNTSASAPADTVTGVACATNYSLVFPQTTTLAGANNKLGVNPTLVDPANGNYRLGPGSPAIDGADPVTPGTADFDGTTRPQGTRSDMGAFELKQ